LGQRRQRKRHEKCVLFLDDGFGDSNANRLREAGYEVELFQDHFRDQHTRLKQHSIKDPTIFTLCDKKGWLLITTDHEMLSTHIEEIKQSSELAILSTSHNNAPDFQIWTEALITGKLQILRYFKNQERPSFAKFNTSGQITNKRTITEADFSRRNRPREKPTQSAKAS
jgi:hypothetical protein